MIKLKGNWKWNTEILSVLLKDRLKNLRENLERKNNDLTEEFYRKV